MCEIHLFIIWSKGKHQKEKILDDIANNLTILNVFNVTWSKSKFSENLSRFYGENLPKNSNKEKHCGNETFTCIIVRDDSPLYEFRRTSRSYQVVNSNLFDKKSLYRNWTGGGHKIHATDNIDESKLQLVLLFNEMYGNYLKANVWDNIEHDFNRDIVGANGWSSFEELFNVLNETTTYVVLRNYLDIEAELNALHPDVDLLTKDQLLAANILNAKPTKRQSYRVQHSVVIDNKIIYFDLRYIGDNYYCEKWERNILLTRIKYENIFVPNDINYYFSLIYHAALHKTFISEDYVNKLISLSLKMNKEINLIDFVGTSLLDILTDFMDKSGYQYTEPKDISVYWNNQYLSKIVPTKIISFSRFIRYFPLKTFVVNLVINTTKVIVNNSGLRK